MLEFIRASTNDGFRCTALSMFNNVAPDVIIREILQNSLDSSQQANRSTTRVKFRLTSIPTKLIPGIEVYKKHFNLACETQEKLGTFEQAKQITDLIQAELKKDLVSVLWVMDNGQGLDPNNMDNLLGDGSSGKNTAVSTGSYGNGHMTLFPASNLRYLLYGGIFKDKFSKNVQQIFAGHTILASHQDRTDPQNPFGPFGKDGFWVKKLYEDNLLGRFEYYNSAPNSHLQKLLDEIETKPGFGTGAIIGILSFNLFNRFDDQEHEKIAETIQNVAAVHFTPAIYSGKMEIDIELHDTCPYKISTQNLEEILSRIKHQKRRPRNFSASPPGGQIWDVFHSLGPSHRKTINLVDSQKIEISFRELKPNDGGGETSIHLYRNGMWIANNIPKIPKSAFSEFAPFNAVILLDHSNSLRACDLVRRAEGPQHIDIDLKRLGRASNPVRIELSNLFQALSKKLKDIAPPLETEKFDPNFFTFYFGKEQETKPNNRIPPREIPRPRPTPKPVAPPRTNKHVSVRQGVALNSRTTHVVKDDGIILHLLPIEDSPQVELRLRRNTGSDSTCENPISGDLISIELGVTVDGCKVEEIGYLEDNEKKFAVLIGSVQAQSEVEIWLPCEIEEGANLEVELFRRAARMSK